MVDVKFRLLKPNQKEEVPHKLSNLTDSQIAEREQRVKQMCKENKNKKTNMKYVWLSIHKTTKEVGNDY